MWGGLVANIPAGWALCDGQNGTPDLRGRFIKGTDTPGATGGAATHTHAAHAALAHTGATVGDHAANTTGANSGAAVKVGTSGSNAAPTGHTHSTPALVHTVGQADQHAAQSHDTPNHEPPYYALAFIQKL